MSPGAFGANLGQKRYLTLLIRFVKPEGDAKRQEALSERDGNGLKLEINMHNEAQTPDSTAGLNEEGEADASDQASESKAGGAPGGGAKREDTRLQGVVVVDKPLGWSSMTVIRKVRRAAGTKRVGHAGTLDPLATGVVVVCMGKATKLVERLMGQTKVYVATVDLSAFSDTDDREGVITPVEVKEPPVLDRVTEVLKGFVGEVMQTPPVFSAIHVGGQRAYDLARKGKEVKMAPRQVRIDSVVLVKYAWPELIIEVTCGKGTYIRSLARDIGKALGTGGHLSGLRRTRVGALTVEMALANEKLLGTVVQGDLMGVDDVRLGIAGDRD
jgi:tRNA pseudouridine55 synthase